MSRTLRTRWASSALRVWANAPWTSDSAFSRAWRSFLRASASAFLAAIASFLAAIAVRSFVRATSFAAFSFL